jgi:hypothetical protein
LPQESQPPARLLAQKTQIFGGLSQDPIVTF